MPPTPMLNERVRVLQILAAALIAGLLIACGTLVLVASRAEGPVPLRVDFPLWIAAPGVALLSLIVAPLTLRGLAPGLAKAVQQPASTASPTEAQTARDAGFSAAVVMTVLRLAILEGAGIVGLVIYFLIREPLALTGPAVSLLGMLYYFPRQSRVARDLLLLIRHLRADVDADVKG